MEQVDVYTHSNLKGFKKGNGTVQYALTISLKGKVHVVDGCLEVRNVTENQSELIVLIEALKRMNRSCVLCIHTESKYLVSCLENKWVDEWRARNWVNAKGNIVANAEEWKELDELLAKHRYSFDVRKKNVNEVFFVEEIRRKKHV